MKKIFIVLFIFFFYISNCKAESFEVGEYIDGAYIRKEKGSLNHYLHSQFVYKESDGKFVYCIEPFEKINTEDEYNEYEDHYLNHSHLDSNTWDYINAAAYFGYMYDDHDDPIWYSITQVVIWQIVEPNADIYFTDRLNGNIIHDYDDMIDELYELIESYFNTDELPNDVTLNYQDMKSYPLNDNYRINRSDNGAGMQPGKPYNKLLLTALFSGTRNYTLYKGRVDNTILYTHNDAQNLIWVYEKPYVESKLKFTSLAGKISINLNYQDEYYSACTSDTETKYGLFDENDNLIMYIYTSGTSNLLKYGKYYVKQLEHSCKYKEDNNIYEIDLDNGNVNKTIDVLERHKKVHIIHNICSSKECVIESNVSFNFKMNDIDITYITDINGEIVFDTGDNTYNINQLDGNSNYSYTTNYLLDLSTYVEDDVYIELNGYLKKADILVNVLDEDKKSIDNAKVCLYDSFDKLIECGYSNKGSVLFNDIEYGYYYVMEEDIDYKYILNNDKFNIELFDDKELDIINKRINILFDNPETSDTNINLLVYMSSIMVILLKKLIKII